MSRSGSKLKVFGALAALSCAVVATLSPPSGLAARAASLDPAVAQDAGAWDMAFEKGNRRCRLFLKQDSRGSAYALAMPAGCHRAFPMLSKVVGWAPADGDHVLFEAESGAPVLDFGPTGAPNLSAIANESDVYTLTPNSEERQAALSGAVPQAAAEPPPAETDVAAAKPARAAVAPARRVTVAEVAGHYAVMRQGKDTGCMVTLEDKAPGPKSSLRARLAPACRDQGIVIFDPAGWEIVRNELVLTAKKGHSTELNLQDDGTWANAPAKGRALVLKRL
jgi:hypothetical protein